MSDKSAGSPSATAIRRLAALPEAEHWAHDCGWLPGTGYCLQRDCAAACIFHIDREHEREQIRIWRMQRRGSRSAFSGRGRSR